MATPPPLNPQPKKTGCAKGCLFVAVIGFVAIMLIGVIGNLVSNMGWKKDRPSILASVEQALDAGDYQRAFLLAAPHQFRNDSELTALVARAQGLKRASAERTHQERIATLVTEIKIAQGEQREKKLEQLVALAPNTNEFPEELRAIREKIKQRQEEARAKAEAERQAELKRKEQQKKEKARLAMEAMLAEFKWRYHVTTDELTSKPTYLAVVKSINQVSFDFPYQGIQRGALMLRTHPQYGKDLILRVEKGQMLVRSYEDTAVKVVFDEGSPISYRVVGPSDHGTTSLFIRDYSGFVGRMMKAKKVKVSVPFYQQGNVVFEFNVSDFDSDRYLNKK